MYDGEGRGVIKSIKIGVNDASMCSKLLIKLEKVKISSGFQFIVIQIDSLFFQVLMDKFIKRKMFTLINLLL